MKREELKTVKIIIFKSSINLQQNFKHHMIELSSVYIQFLLRASLFTHCI